MARNPERVGLAEVQLEKVNIRKAVHNMRE